MNELKLKYEKIDNPIIKSNRHLFKPNFSYGTKYDYFINRKNNKLSKTFNKLIGQDNDYATFSPHEFNKTRKINYKLIKINKEIFLNESKHEHIDSNKKDVHPLSSSHKCFYVNLLQNKTHNKIFVNDLIDSKLAYDISRNKFHKFNFNLNSTKSIFPKINNSLFSSTSYNKLGEPKSSFSLSSIKSKDINDNKLDIMNKEDDYLYKKIFHNNKKKKFKLGTLINNKLNIFYAEDNDQYEVRLFKLNEYLKKISKPIKHLIKPEKVAKKVNYVQDSVNFMKSVMDYVYPNILINKIKLFDKKMYKSKSEVKLLPFKEIDLKKKIAQEELNSILNETIHIQNYRDYKRQFF